MAITAFTHLSSKDVTTICNRVPGLTERATELVIARLYFVPMPETTDQIPKAMAGEETILSSSGLKALGDVLAAALMKAKTGEIVCASYDGPVSCAKCGYTIHRRDGQPLPPCHCQGPVFWASLASASHGL